VNEAQTCAADQTQATKSGATGGRAAVSRPVKLGSLLQGLLTVFHVGITISWQQHHRRPQVFKNYPMYFQTILEDIFQHYASIRNLIKSHRKIDIFLSIGLVGIYSVLNRRG